MSLEGTIIGLLFLLGVIAIVGAPLFNRRPTLIMDDARLTKQRERVLLVYERILTNIRDLDEDHSTGKMQTADYEAERESWVQRGIQALKALDGLDAQQTLIDTADEGEIDRAIDTQIEDAVARYRAKVQN